MTSNVVSSSVRSENFSTIDAILDKARLYRTSLFMGFSALLTSAAVIIYSNTTLSTEQITGNMQ
ncbi:hypothetical protein GF377_02760, partial [candidate division GN15 bacterium]|nr:hypothetical protein [candidate division GN15 bacterium]